MRGFFTDLQWFGRALTTTELHDFTSCKAFLKGDVYSFNPDDWEVYDKDLQKNSSIKVQYRVVDLDTNSFCKSDTKFTYFPDDYDMTAGTRLCKRFGGRKIDISTKEKVSEIKNWMFSLRSDPDFHLQDSYKITSYGMFTDEKENNVWANYETGEVAKDPFNWKYGEPNGGEVENCADLQIMCTDCGSMAENPEKWNNLDNWDVAFNDMPCQRTSQVSCLDIGVVVLTLRGRNIYAR